MGGWLWVCDDRRFILVGARSSSYFGVGRPGCDSSQVRISRVS
jgi:hypothetical protein